MTYDSNICTPQYHVVQRHYISFNISLLLCYHTIIKLNSIFPLSTVYFSFPYSFDPHTAHNDIMSKTIFSDVVMEGGRDPYILDENSVTETAVNNLMTELPLCIACVVIECLMRIGGIG